MPLEDLVEDEGADVAEDEEGDGKPKKKRKNKTVYSDFAFTGKLQTLVNELKRVRDQDLTGTKSPGFDFRAVIGQTFLSHHLISCTYAAKSLVFSQYTSTLKYLQTELPKHGFLFRTLSGDMSMVQRAKALRDFQNDPPTTVFLLSMR